MSGTPVSVRDNHDATRLEIETEGRVAVLEYEITGDVMAITHTIVPSEFGGRGYGTLLAAAAMAKAEKEQLKVVPECSFIVAYMKKNPETQKLAHSSVTF